MAGKKIWSIYEVGATYEGPLTEIEASSEKSALDNTASHFGVRRNKLYAVPGALLTEKPASGRSHARRKLPDRYEIPEPRLKGIEHSEGFQIGDAVQFRWEPDMGGVIRRLASNSEASVMTPHGERSVSTDALRHVHKAHVDRVRRAVESGSHATKRKHHV